MLSCAEASGDLYAGALVRELKALEPNVAVAGFGGPHFAGAGGELMADYRGLAVTGITEAIPKIPRLFGDAAAAGRRGSNQASRRSCRHRFRPISIFGSPPPSTGSACRSSITSARRFGRGGRVG